MMAISDSLPTYVVFACQSNSGQQVNPNLWGRAYAIFQDQDNVNFQVVQRTAWLYLPDNVAFKVNATSSGTSLDTASVTNQDMQNASDNNPSFPVSGSALPAGTSNATSSISVQLPYWKFDNTGMVVQKALTTSANTTPNQRGLLPPAALYGSRRQQRQRNFHPEQRGREQQRRPSPRRDRHQPGDRARQVHRRSSNQLRHRQFRVVGSSL